MRAIKTTLLLTGLTLILVMGGNALGGRTGLTYGLILAVAMNGTAYFFSDRIALKSSGAQPVTREQEPRLYAVMERLCAKAHLPMPKLFLIPQPAPNAFATGRNPTHASVAVTAGLMELMDDEELEGVIAHELSHVRNYDILTSSIAATLAGAITWAAHMGRWAMIFGGYGGNSRDRRGGGLATLLMLFVAPIAALLLQLGISRQREYQADASGAQMVGKAWRLQQTHSHEHLAHHLGALHRRASYQWTNVQRAIQYPSTPGKAHRHPQGYVRHSLNTSNKAIARPGILRWVNALVR